MRSVRSEAVLTVAAANTGRFLGRRFVTHKYFDYFITGCILINTITLSMDHYPVPDAGKDYYPADSEPEAFKAVESINMVLTYVFIVEMFLKLPALGPMGYASDPFNLFDAFIVTTSIVEIIMVAASDSEEGGASGMSALRTFRLFRVFKLAKQWTEMQILLKAMVRTTFDIANFAVLLILFMYIMALVGMQFFANEMHFDAETNFKVEFDDKVRACESRSDELRKLLCGISTHLIAANFVASLVAVRPLQQPGRHGQHPQEQL